MHGRAAGAAFGRAGARPPTRNDERAPPEFRVGDPFGPRGLFSGWTRADNPIKLRPPAASRRPAPCNRKVRMCSVCATTAGNFCGGGGVVGAFGGFKGRGGTTRRSGEGGGGRNGSIRGDGMEAKGGGRLAGPGVWGGGRGGA
ncbi:polyamine ABC transporter substrate-binding protein, partial [Burkholderia pseudomallei]